MVADTELAQLAAEIVSRAKPGGKKISFAESCTGGLAAAAVTSVAGASEIFMGSAVTYSNEAKESILGVSKKTLADHGAVSSECASEMARGARKIYGSDISVSITGIAGPDGGTKEKPVGTVWFAVDSSRGNRTFKRRFPGNRNGVRLAAAKEALETVLRETEGCGQ